MSSIVEMLGRIRINVLQFFVPIGSRFIFWLRRKLNIPIRCRQVLPPFPDPDIPMDELFDDTDVVEPEVHQMVEDGIFQGPSISKEVVSPSNYDDFTLSLRRASTSTSEFGYIFRNQNFSYISDTDAGSPTTNPETDSD